MDDPMIPQDGIDSGNADGNEPTIEDLQAQLEAINRRYESSSEEGKRLYGRVTDLEGQIRTYQQLLTDSKRQEPPSLTDENGEITPDRLDKALDELLESKLQARFAPMARAQSAYQRVGSNPAAVALLQSNPELQAAFTETAQVNEDAAVKFLNHLAAASTPDAGAADNSAAKKRDARPMVPTSSTRSQAATAPQRKAAQEGAQRMDALRAGQPGALRKLIEHRLTGSPVVGDMMASWNHSPSSQPPTE